MSELMTALQSEITALEERLRLAELGPDPAFFEEALADEMVLIAEDGQPSFAKTKIVAAHRPGEGPKFTQVEVKDLKIVNYGAVAVVTGQGTYTGLGVNANLKFMRVWIKHHKGWQIVAASVSK